jgi:formylglycine-generating enzyme required for sulfatase activity
MKKKLRFLLIALSLLAGIHPAAAQGARFFRVSGPAATAITAFRPDGTLVWSNALAGTNYTVQTAISLGGGTNWVDYVQLPVTKGVNTNQIIALNPPSGMALVPAGSFQMGDNLDGLSDAPVHTVYVSAFYMDQDDVSLTQWQQVYNWATNHGYGFEYAGSGKASNHPLESVNWYNCVKWCNARSEMEGRTPAYYTNAAQTTVYRSGETVLASLAISNACVNWNAGYRLPTEAEWEKAARGGLSGQRFPWGNTISWSQANYYGNPHSAGGYTYDFAAAIGFDPAFDAGGYPFTSPTGYFPANGYGLHDMAGNVFQWCWDWYGTYGSGSDPRGPTSGNNRVIRGGDWFDYANHCRTAYRLTGDPANSVSYDIGFRTILPADQ